MVPDRQNAFDGTVSYNVLGIDEIIETSTRIDFFAINEFARTFARTFLDSLVPRLSPYAAAT